ncbi:hypothetical protein KR018_000980 [Drosophila ironensis]|nr:hypothetical protein KR018_000980 [Drosophila ironensis]
MPRKEIFVKEKKKFIWSDDATDALVNMWLDKADAFRAQGKNTIIHAEMAKALVDFGPNPVEIKAKLDCLKKRYRRELGKMRVLDENTSTWEYFPIIHKIFRHEFARPPSPVIDESPRDIRKLRNVKFEDMDETRLIEEEINNEYGDAEELIDLPFDEPRPKRSRRMQAQILQEERLAVQRDSVNVMRSISRELSNLHASFLIAFKQKHLKRKP